LNKKIASKASVFEQSEGNVKTKLLVLCILSLTLASCAQLPTPDEANDAVLLLRDYRGWAWAAGIGLIWADLILPIPQTSVIAALGIIYGTWVGGLLGSLALITNGLIAYGLMQTSARKLVLRFLKAETQRKIETMFDRAGAWAIILTRSLGKSIPEIVVFLAGIAGMPLRKFTAALFVGSVPIAFVFAALGAGWADQPIMALVASYALPIILLPLVLYLMRNWSR
jgi:uncharacterized membrane protein YdjX (TVP38/TMEM64 family)